MFQGFSEETIRFLWGIRLQNEKPWFEAHREEYEMFLRRPMEELAREVYSTVTQACPELALELHISRIYRDARRLHGRGPYKDRLWFSLRPPAEEWTHTPVFWFEITPENYSYGMGYYHAKPVTMAKLRARIDRAPRELEKLVADFNRQSEFQLEGEDYQRPKGDPGPLLAPWYRKKNLGLCCERLHGSLLFSPELASAVAQGFLRLVPLYRYFLSLEGDPDPRQ